MPATGDSLNPKLAIDLSDMMLACFKEELAGVRESASEHPKDIQFPRILRKRKDSVNILPFPKLLS